MRRPFVFLALVAVSSLGACVKRPPPAADVLRKMAADGYTPNPGLSGLVQPGNIIQTMEMGPDGQPRPLSPPLVLAWGTDCFPGLEPREGPYALAAESGEKEAGLTLEGPEAARLFPALKASVDATSGQRMKMTNPRVRAFARGDVSGKLSQKCVDVLRQAFAEGDRPEWFSLVIEAIVADGFTLELVWRSGVGAEVRDRVTETAAQAVDAVAPPIIWGATPAGASTTAPATGTTVVTDPFAVQPTTPGTTAAPAATDPFATPAVTDPFAVPGTAASPAYGQPTPAPKAHGARVRIGTSTSKSTLIELTGAATVAYRTRTLSATYGQPGAAAPAGTLRDTFAAAAGAGAVPIGRLAVRALDGGSRRVRVDHPFRSGESFQLEVTADRAGWLFVFHGEPGATPALLWPRPGAAAGEWLDDNALRAGVPALVPPSPASFRMDERTGDERFWVALTSERAPPPLGRSDAAPVAPAPAPSPVPAGGGAGPDRIVQFAVRGPAGQPVRGVLFDPGGAGADPGIYFTAPAGDPAAFALVEFVLNHGN